MRKHFPNLVTSFNLLSGVVGIVLVMNGNTAYASLMIVLAGVFDFFDGLTARWLGVQSPIGRELDSLADVVSFGVLPGLILLRLYQFYSLDYNGIFWVAAGWLSLLFPVFSALRLARFNVDTLQEFHFRGLPTPAASLVVASLDSPGGLSSLFDAWIMHPLLLVSLGLILCILMVSDVPFFGLKIKRLSLGIYPVQFGFLGLSMVLVLLTQMAGVGMSLLIYLGINLTAAVLKKEI
jgi:CDP-diacylglycerol--serine O-phosphatidyltransferase